MKKVLISLLLTACFLYANEITLGVEIVESKEKNISIIEIIVKGIFIFITSIFILGETLTIFKDKKFDIFTINKN